MSLSVAILGEEFRERATKKCRMTIIQIRIGDRKIWDSASNRRQDLFWHGISTLPNI
jgi:hypothetical protein